VNPLRDLLTNFPVEDAAALRKYWDGRLPEPVGLGERPAVLVVDMTRGFVEDRFPMGWSATGVPCVRAIHELLDVARPAGLPVFFTRGASFTRDSEIGVRLRGRRREEFRQGVSAEEHEIMPALAPLTGDVVIEKSKPSAFYGTQLEAMLTYIGADSVILTGMVTSGCVRATAVDAFSRNLRVVIPVECVADRSQLSHRVALVDLGVKYADLTTLGDLRAALQSAAG
jgi:nicotinamidase-related amidase